MRIPSNKVCDIERFAYSELAELYSRSEIRNLLQILFEHFLGWSVAHLLVCKNKTINQSDLLKFNFAIKDLRNGKPIQYIVGKVDFCDVSISVSKDTLIPRPETAELVYLISGNENPGTILDICTGSGCIAVALAKRLAPAKVFATDISVEALKIAEQNSKANSVEVCFAYADILQGDNPFEQKEFDVIVSNPPYVREMEKQQMHKNVLDYEPHLALFVSDSDPLIFYRHIALFANKYLKQGGKLYLEINEAFGNDTATLLQEQGYRTTVHKDLFGKERIIEAQKAII